MIIDADEGSVGAAPFDDCVVGAGAAGITLAVHLARAGRRVALVESGRGPSDEQQDLYTMDVAGLPYDPRHSRLRFFGGTTNHWGGWCREIDPVEFADGPAGSARRWPIPFFEIEPFYRPAAAICEIDATRRWTMREWEREMRTETAGRATIVDTDRVATRVWQYSPPVRFGPKYEAEIAGLPNLILLLGGNLVQAAFDGDVVQALSFRTLAGREFTLRARTFTLSCGALENARIMLMVASNGQVPGNRGGNVGRFFTDHVVANEIAELISTTGDFHLYSDKHETSARRPSGTAIKLRAHFALTANTLAENNIANIVARLEPPTDLDASGPASDALLAFVARHDASSHRGTPVRIQRSRLVILLDHEPASGSTVRLDPSKRDTFGLPRAVLDWRLNDAADANTVDRFCRVVGEELASLKIGRLRRRTRQSLSDIVRGGGWVGNHHIGTTRMARSEEDGVVDTDLKVFGLRNLFVGGSSVFPSASASTPTLTIVALALRLAAHIRAA